jgi:competence protein ComEA
MKNRKCAMIILVILLTFGLSSFASAKDDAAVKSKPVLEGQLNINTATAKELKLLPGIGEKTAANVIEYRTQNGNYTESTSLLKVKGIGKKTLEKITAFIIFEGETTLAKKKPVNKL